MRLETLLAPREWREMALAKNVIFEACHSVQYAASG